MYNLGDLSYIANLPVAIIKLYDELNILVPTGFSLETGYSYYTENDIKKLRQIKSLIKAGFTIDEIKQSIGCFNDRQLLTKKQQLLDNGSDMQAIKEIDKLRSII